MKQRIHKILLLGLLSIYLVLAYKNPFSDRSLIPNLEPYPDTLYYSYPGWSWIKGKGFGMNYGGDSVPTIVPPGYTWWLIPFMAVFNDVRGFYYANLVLQLGTIVLVLATLKKIYRDAELALAVTLFTGWMLVSNFYFYNLPSLLMSENLTIFCVALGLYLLVCPITFWKQILTLFTAVLMWLIKLANLPLGISFLLLYAAKIGKEKGIKALLKFGGVAVLIAGLFYFGYIRNSVTSAPPDREGFTAFSTTYFVDNIRFYIRSIIGGSTRYLWFTNRLIPSLYAMMLLIGLILAVVKKKYLWIAIVTLGIWVPQLVATAFYYYPDSRYIFSMLPALAIVIGVPISMLWQKSKRITWGIIAGLIVIQLTVPLFNEQAGESKMVSLKKQVGLNFKYREDPWNYNAVVHLNQYLADKPGTYVGTFLPPYYVAMFKTANYEYLPISPTQEFSGNNRPLIDNMYRSDGSIPAMYRRLILGGSRVVITNAYVNNSKAWETDLNNLKTVFDAELVSEGCLGSCTIYQLKLK